MREINVSTTVAQKIEKDHVERAQGLSRCLFLHPVAVQTIEFERENTRGCYRQWGVPLKI